MMQTTVGLGFGLLIFPDTGLAADPPLKTPAAKAVYDWTGLYVGAHVGFSRGVSNPTLTDPAAAANGNVFDGMIAGVQVGYSYRLNSGLLLGVEGDVSFPNYLHANQIVSSAATPRSITEEDWDYVATLRGRLGYTTGSWLFYTTGGFAFAGERFLNTPTGGTEDKKLNRRLGWTAGAGVEYAFAPHWTARLEYLYRNFENANVSFPSGVRYSSSMDSQSIDLGLNRKIDWLGVPVRQPSPEITDAESDRWEIHGQSTFVGQGYPAFQCAL